MSNYYCENCGSKSSSIQDLTTNNCAKHPNGINKGRHSLYQGTEKSQYFCKYCGSKSSSIKDLTANKCFNHPNGVSKGFHSPAL
jgi:DNA-directed RNA polymerase subunit RPC12/RpoP